MKDKDYIKELFSEKLSNHEVPVRSDLWAGIQSQIGGTTASTVATKAISSTVKWMIGVASSAVVVGTAVWFSSTDKTSTSNEVKPMGTATSTTVSNPADREVIQSYSTEKTSASLAMNGEERKDVGYNKLGTEAEFENNVFFYADPTFIPEQPVVVDAGLKEAPVANSAPESPAQEKAPEPNISEKTAPVAAIPDGKIEELFNVFTPNGDGANDYFFLKSVNLKDFTIRIFNERDQLVFESSDKDFKWFGYDLAGNMVEKGNYGYVIFATDLNGKSIKLFKNLTIR